MFRIAILSIKLGLITCACTPMDDRLLSRSNGQRCDTSAECASGHCEASVAEGDRICCAIDCPSGHSCDRTGQYCPSCEGEECQQDCDLDNANCLYSEPNGEACVDDSQCASAYCGQDFTGRQLCCDSACGIYGTCDLDGKCSGPRDPADFQSSPTMSGGADPDANTDGKDVASDPTIDDTSELTDGVTDDSDVMPQGVNVSAPDGSCGDGLVGETEDCDGEATCSEDCRWIVCGDEQRDEGEECDPPSASSCTATCREIRCGNARVDEGEECEPPEASHCNADCLLVACGDQRVDEEEGEECDPPTPSECSALCKHIECGNGRIDEGEGCDPPQQGQCDDQCRLDGCGNGSREGEEECDPPESGVCDGQCRLIACGNGRRDEGEECDYAVDELCGDDCLAIECGNGRVDEGEGCDPPTFGSCSRSCATIACNDGVLDEGEQCEPSLATAGTCTDSCTTLSVGGTEYLYTFDNDVQDWSIYATSPDRLKADTSLRFDSQNGDVSPGCLRVSCAFDASNQKVEFQSTPTNALDLTGRILEMRVRLESGLSSDTAHPGGVKIFVKSGSDWSYASGAWTYLAPGGGWVDVRFNADEPVLNPSGDYSAKEVRQFGLELRTFEETQDVAPAVLFVDSVSY